MLHALVYQLKMLTVYSAVGLVGGGPTIKIYSPKKISSFIERGRAFTSNVEIMFFGHPGSLKMAGTAQRRPKKFFKDQKVSEIRKAIAYRLKNDLPELSYSQISCMLGMKDHTSSMKCIERAKEHIDSNDTEFMGVYNLVKDIII